jgi:hypothetical protein
MKNRRSLPPAMLVRKMEFSLFNGCFYLYHDIWRDRVHFMGSFCVFCNFSHQLSFGGSRGLEPTVLGKTYKGWHLLHQCVIILCLFMFFCPSISGSSKAGVRDLKAVTGPGKQVCRSRGVATPAGVEALLIAPGNVIPVDLRSNYRRFYKNNRSCNTTLPFFFMVRYFSSIVQICSTFEIE